MLMYYLSPGTLKVFLNWPWPRTQVPNNGHITQCLRFITGLDRILHKLVYSLLIRAVTVAVCVRGVTNGCVYDYWRPGGSMTSTWYGYFIGLRVNSISGNCTYIWRVSFIVYHLSWDTLYINCRFTNALRTINNFYDCYVPGTESGDDIAYVATISCLTFCWWTIIVRNPKVCCVGC